MYGSSLYHARKGYEIKPNNADVLRSLIRSHHVMGNIDERYKILQEMRKQFASRVYPGEFLMAEQEHELFHSEWQPKALPDAALIRMTVKQCCLY
jgi:hypothetical protein